MLYLCGSTMLLMWVFVMSMFDSFLGENSCLRAYSPGDIIIGGLFPIHLKTNRTETPGPVSCSDYDLQMFLRSQVMIYAIREISLPDITIGYDIYDTCGDVSLAIMATLELLKNQSDPQSCLLPAEPQTKVVIGETSSEVSIAVARIVALSSVAQISYASTSELLSRKFKFPAFLRTVPSDEYQTKGIVELVKTFHWQTVFIVGSDDEYGKYGSDGLVNTFSETNVCVEAVHILSADFMKNNSQTQRKLNELLGDIKNSSAEAIILFTKGSNVKIILGAAIKDKVNRTWIASDSWSNSPTISAMPGIEHIGQVFGFIFKQSEVPGFKDYVMSMFNGTKNDILNYHLTQHPLCSNQSEEKRANASLPTRNQLGSKQCLDPNLLATYIDKDQSYSIYLAVQVIAEGLRCLLKCDNHQCERSSNFTPSELLSEIQKVNFSVGTTRIFFNSDGDPNLGYNIVYWNMSEFHQRAQIHRVGEYHPDGEIEVQVHHFRHLINQTGSVYNCSKTCDPGQELKMETKKCCPVCVPCASGEFSPGNGSTCKHCGEKRYSLDKQRNECLNKRDEFLQWSDPFSIILCSLAAVGIILTVVFTVLFAVYLRTPIVKAVGGYLCFLELFSLLAAFCLIFTFIGKPTKSSDCMGLPLFGIAFTLCIACILANLFQILVGFNFDLQRGSCIKKLNKPLLLVTIISGVQLALSVSWLIKEPPTPKENTDFSDKTTLHQCEFESLHHFLAMLAYNGFLGLICFVFAFKGKQLPDLYKNASLITIGMLMFIVIWIIFLPIYLTLTGMYKPAVEAAAILTSCFSILGCHLAPKCYIMLFRKELNHQNAITEYIRKHYERKGISVVQS
ncbi:G-protein coupled receptor family C group 6 member A-like [Archocentrus centrarchus]|uniref:G-protein coupled receptor family C group 6 member A-like n=1 Tax=Archocentrus centrarchus TaxID=63155 RepID=UPI0011E9E0B2|nr:G-protein coupled receptor family C group 6 member A-like [Archocentrus centrarchus]